MNTIEWINLSDFQNQIQQLINQHNLVFVEFEYYVDLKRMLQTLKELYPNYTTPLFEADWLAWNYDDPDNLTLLKTEMMRNPNDRYYLEIRPSEKYYTICNHWRVNQAFEKKQKQCCSNNNIVVCKRISYHQHRTSTKR